MMAFNPYIAGDPVGNRKSFIGRKKLLAEVKTLLVKQECHIILLYGQRRIGKTSLLQYIERELRKEDSFTPVFFDLQPRAGNSLGEILRQLADTIFLKLDLPDDLEPKPSRLWKPEQAFKETWLPGVLASLSSEKSLVLLLDEFDVLAHPGTGVSHSLENNELPGSDLLTYLPDLLVENAPALKCVVVIGRHGKDLSIAAQSLLRIPHQRLISLLGDGNDVEDLIRLSEKNETLRWDDTAVRRVIQLTNGHPYFTQLICHHVWNLKHNEVSAPVLPLSAMSQDVSAVIPNVFAEIDQHLVSFWDTLSPAERVVTAMLASSGPGLITPAKLDHLLRENKIRLAIREIESAPQSLRERDLLEELEDGNLQFRVELIRQWIEKNWPLEKVQKDVDAIEAIVENQYQAASKLFHESDYERALAQTNEALKTNPYHIKSRQLLADILSKQGDLDEAQRVLEDLHKDEPGEAKNRLVDIYMQQAKRIDSNDERLEWYNKVLGINDTHRDARNGAKDCWYWIAIAAEGRANEKDNLLNEKLSFLNEALNAYEASERRDDIERIKKIIKPVAMAVGKKHLDDLEKAEEYEEAIEFLREWNEKYPSSEWGEYQQRLSKLAEIARCYREAIDALINGNSDLATERLLWILERDYTYKDTVLRFYETVTGVNSSKTLNHLVEVQDQFKQANTELQQCRNEIVELFARIDHLEDEKSSADSEVNRLHTELVNAEKREQDAIAALHQSEHKMESQKRRIGSLEETLRAQGLQLTAELEKKDVATKRRIQDLESDWEKRIQQLQVNNEQLSQEVAKYKGETAQCKKQLEANRAVSSRHNGEVYNLKSTLKYYQIAFGGMTLLLLLLLGYLFFIH